MRRLLSFRYLIYALAMLSAVMAVIFASGALTAETPNIVPIVIVGAIFAGVFARWLRSPRN